MTTFREQQVADAARRDTHNAKLRADRAAARAAAGLPPAPRAAVPAPLPAPIVPPAPDPARVEFERVRAAALARIADEKKVAADALAARQAAQRAEDEAVEAILQSHALACGKPLRS